MTTTGSMSSGSLQVYVLLAFSLKSLKLQLRKLHTLQVRGLHCDSLLYPRCLATKFCPSLIDNISLRVASCRTRNFNPVTPIVRPLHVQQLQIWHETGYGLDGPGIESR
jgi:hypothetical protein